MRFEGFEKWRRPLCEHRHVKTVSRVLVVFPFTYLLTYFPNVDICSRSRSNARGRALGIHRSRDANGRANKAHRALVGVAALRVARREV